MAKPLHERIASARSTDRVTITDLTNLIAEAKAERDQNSELATQAIADSVNFALGEDDREEAAAKSARAARNCQALTAAIDDLERRLAAKQESEGHRAKQAHKAAIIAQRDALAERFKAEWPDIESRIVDLLSAAKANDEAMKAAGIYEPSAEAVARGVPGNFYVGARLIRQLSALKLPAFSNTGDLAWPITGSQQKWADDADRLYRQQRENEAARVAQEAASWKPYRITPGMAHQTGVSIAIDVKNDGNDRGASSIEITNLRLCPDDPPVTHHFWLKPQTVEHLRRHGTLVETEEVAP